MEEFLLGEWGLERGLFILGFWAIQGDNFIVRESYLCLLLITLKKLNVLDKY